MTTDPLQRLDPAAPHHGAYEALVASTLASIDRAPCPGCGHEAIPDLIRAIGHVAAGDFSKKPDIPQDDHPLSILTVGIRFLIEDLEASARNLDPTPLRREIVRTTSEGLTAPLTPILLQLHVLRRIAASTEIDPAMQRSIDIITRNVMRLERSVRTCIDLVRCEGGIPEAGLEPVDLRLLAENVLAELEERATARSVLVTLDAVGPVPLLGDARYLDQLLWHLSANAVEASPPGSSVAVAIQQDPQTVRVTVTDQGDGLTMELFEQVFEPFARMHDDRRGGLGLGLTLAKRIVTEHGGRIWCESEGPGLGSRFSFVLPNDPRQHPEA